MGVKPTKGLIYLWTTGELLRDRAPIPGSASNKACRRENGVVPIRQIGSGFVRALRELQDFCARRPGASHVVIHQDELVQLVAIRGRRRPNPLLAKACGFRGGVGIEGRSRHVSPAGPPSHTAALMRIRFRCDDALAGRSRATAETCATQIEASPKEVYRTRLADESRAKLLQHNVG